MLPSTTHSRRVLLASLILTFAVGCGDGDGKTKDAGGSDAGTVGRDASADAGSAGETCGGIAGLTCGAGTFCNYEVAAGGSGCEGIADAAGICETLPTACPEIYAPVCGCNNRTYSNACSAHAAGAAVKHVDVCTAEECMMAGGRPEYSDGASTPMCKDGEDSFQIPGIEPAICCVPAQVSEFRWYRTCGAPVCGSPNQPPSDLPACDTQKLGAACEKQGQECDLRDDCSTHLICEKSDPTQGPGGCPISRANSKVNIRYLEAADLAKKHDEILALSLAEYTYRNDPAEEPRLGFIIEDVEPSDFVQEARNRVDLYAYTSAVIAAVKVQEQHIRALEAQVRSLSQKLEKAQRNRTP